MEFRHFCRFLGGEIVVNNTSIIADLKRFFDDSCRLRYVVKICKLIFRSAFRKLLVTIVVFLLRS